MPSLLRLPCVRIPVIEKIHLFSISELGMVFNDNNTSAIAGNVFLTSLISILGQLFKQNSLYWLSCNCIVAQISSFGSGLTPLSSKRLNTPSTALLLTLCVFSNPV